MATLPPNPPTLTPPAVPDGWRADWSPQYNTWYYFNLSTQASQWENPLGQAQQPLSPPSYGVHNVPPQQYAPPLQQEGNVGQQDPLPPDGDKGLGKIGGGLLGAAGGLLAGAFLTHEIDEHKNHHKQKLNFWSDGNKPGGSGGLLAGIGSRLPFGNSTPGAGIRPGGGSMPFASSLPFGNSHSPPLHIHCAAYSTQDVTQQVRRMVTANQSLEIDTGSLKNYFGDPWPGNRKQFSVIYSYGQRPWELLASYDNDGMFAIVPHEPLDKERMEFIKDARTTRIVALVWGNGNPLDDKNGAVTKLQEIETSGEFPATNRWMGFDGMCGDSKSAVAYYRTSNGGIAISCAREGGTCRLPWNPLAKWT